MTTVVSNLHYVLLGAGHIWLWSVHKLRFYWVLVQYFIYVHSRRLNSLLIIIGPYRALVTNYIALAIQTLFNRSRHLCITFFYVDLAAACHNVDH